MKLFLNKKLKLTFFERKGCHMIDETMLRNSESANQIESMLIGNIFVVLFF